MGCGQSGASAGAPTPPRSSSSDSAKRTASSPWSSEHELDTCLAGTLRCDEIPDDEEIRVFYEYAADVRRRLRNQTNADRQATNNTGSQGAAAASGARDSLASASQPPIEHMQTWRDSGGSLDSGPREDNHKHGYGLTAWHLAYVAKELGFSDLGESEIERIYSNIPRTPHGEVGMEQFAAAVNTGSDAPALRLLVQKLRKGFCYGFNTPENYDFSRPSAENYKNEEHDFTDEFAHLRRGIDYSYHNNYTLERQRWQDEVIKSTVVRSFEQPTPWLVFTCGPMGVGKGYCMTWMSQRGFFPLENIVHVDPDGFKLMMPEWPKYVKKSGDDAGTLCHMESSMMMEIAQWAAMERRQNVWIDGSLRNADFYAKVFENIRRQYPHYKISIMYIFADEASIRRRIQIRAEKTGRNVPEHLIQASLGAMDKALNKLTPLCDFVARIDNSGAVPVLAAFETVCTKGSWSILKERFARNTIDEADFPRFMPPLPVAKLKQEDLESMQHIQASGALEGQLIVNLSVASFQNSSLRALLEVLSCKSMQRLLMPLPQQIASHIHEQITDSIDKVLPKSVKDVGMGASQRIQKLWTDCAGSAQASLSLATSHLSKVGEDVRSALTIPAGAEHYCWVFPFGNLPLNIQLQLGAEDWHDPLVQLLSNGGFCYCDKDGVVLSVSSVSLKRESTFLQFDVPDMLPRETVDKMIKKCCFHPVTVPYLRERGATKYCWVHAKEAFGRTNVGGSHGAFVYFMNGMQTALRFPAMSS